MTAIIIAIIGSGAFSALVAGIFNLIINRKGRMGKIENQLDEISDRLAMSEKDALRTQLLLMISDYPTEKNEILTLAKHYFGDLNGDWYLTSIFNTWIEQTGGARPEWFNKGE